MHHGYRHHAHGHHGHHGPHKQVLTAHHAAIVSSPKWDAGVKALGSSATAAQLNLMEARMLAAGEKPFNYAETGTAGTSAMPQSMATKFAPSAIPHLKPPSPSDFA